MKGEVLWAIGDELVIITGLGGDCPRPNLTFAAGDC